MQGEIVLQHGWGFDSSFWNSWTANKSFQAQHRCIVPDRGYFTPVSSDWADSFYPNWSDVRFSANAFPRVVIAHSFGAGLLAPEVFQQADLIVLIGSFACFHPTEEKSNKLSRKTISRMRSRFQSEPNQTLLDFFSNCGLPMGTQLPPLETANLNLLAHDLERLDEDTWDTSSFKDKTVLSLRASHDRIVSPMASIDLCERLRAVSANVRDIEIHSEHHAVALTDGEICIGFINDALQKLSPQQMVSRIPVGAGV